MSLDLLTAPSIWARYSKKLLARFDAPHNAGQFTESDAKARGMRLVEGQQGGLEEGNWILLQLLIDPTDGIILDARFQAWGQSALLAGADSACDLLIRKHYEQANRITVELIDRQLRDEPDRPAFPKETYTHLYRILSAISDTIEQCQDLPPPEGYSAPPVPIGMNLEGAKSYPGWETLPLIERQAIIEEVLDREIRPYIALDAGGVILKELTSDHEVLIAYTGACTSCYSSVGSTLAYIQQILRSHVHPDIIVIPE